MWEHCTFDVWFVDVTRFTTLIRLGLLMPCNLPLAALGLNMSSLSTSAVRSLTNFLYGILGNYRIRVPVLC
jgi:hypothetical protein